MYFHLNICWVISPHYKPIAYLINCGLNCSMFQDMRHLVFTKVWNANGFCEAWFMTFLHHLQVNSAWFNPLLYISPSRYRDSGCCRTIHCLVRLLEPSYLQSEWRNSVILCASAANSGIIMTIYSILLWSQNHHFNFPWHIITAITYNRFHVSLGASTLLLIVLTLKECGQWIRYRSRYFNPSLSSETVRLFFT